MTEPSSKSEVCPKCGNVLIKSNSIVGEPYCRCGWNSEPAPAVVEDKFKIYSFINYTKSGTQLNDEREVFVANTAYIEGQAASREEVERLKKVEIMLKNVWDATTEERDRYKAERDRMREALKALNEACEMMERMRQIIPEELRRADTILEYRDARNAASDVLKATPQEGGK